MAPLNQAIKVKPGNTKESKSSVGLHYEGVVDPEWTVGRSGSNHVLTQQYDLTKMLQCS